MLGVWTHIHLDQPRPIACLSPRRACSFACTSRSKLFSEIILARTFLTFFSGFIFVLSYSLGQAFDIFWFSIGQRTILRAKLFAWLKYSKRSQLNQIVNFKTAVIPCLRFLFATAPMKWIPLF